jgi:hypothetical protein
MYIKLKEPKYYIYTQKDINDVRERINNTKQTKIELQSFNWSSACGFFDSEGCINALLYKKNNYMNLRIRIKNTYPYILIKFKEAFGGNVNPRKKSENPKHRQKWEWRTNKKDSVRFFLTKILPYSIIKKPQIELGLKFLETDNYQAKLFISQELKRLKDEEYTEEQIKELNEQIEDMNVDKLQHKLEEYK